MNIGILTFHAQINYGGVLQCFALQETLKKMGHNPIVIDRWFSDNKEELNPCIDYTIKSIIKRCLSQIFKCGETERLKRYKKTKEFICQYLKLTSYSFTNWKDAPHNLGIDAIIVGSDQVWNCTWQNPGAFLLENAPKISALSYAVSFGMPNIPKTLHERYKKGFKRFSFISVREKTGKQLVEELGIKATLVLDPSQLLPPNFWLQSLNIKPKNLQPTKDISKRIVCYFIKEDITSNIPILENFAKIHNYKIDILVQTYTPLPIPKNIKNIAIRLISNYKSTHNPVQLKLSADPREFIELLVNADSIISDSYHALMFASIFHKNIRILQPHDTIRKNMFSRITDFTSSYVNNNIITKDLVTALRSLSKGTSYKNDKLINERNRSFTWLFEKIQLLK